MTCGTIPVPVKRTDATPKRVAPIPCVISVKWEQGLDRPDRENQCFHSNFFHLAFDVARFGHLWPNIIFKIAKNLAKIFYIKSGNHSLLQTFFIPNKFFL